MESINTFIFAKLVSMCKIFKGGHKPNNIGFMQKNPILFTEMYPLIPSMHVITKNKLYFN